MATATLLFNGVPAAVVIFNIVGILIGVVPGGFALSGAGHQRLADCPGYPGDPAAGLGESGGRRAEPRISGVQRSRGPHGRTPTSPLPANLIFIAVMIVAALARCSS